MSGNSGNKKTNANASMMWFNQNFAQYVLQSQQCFGNLYNHTYSGSAQCYGQQYQSGYLPSTYVSPVQIEKPPVYYPRPQPPGGSSFSDNMYRNRGNWQQYHHNYCHQRDGRPYRRRRSHLDDIYLPNYDDDTELDGPRRFQNEGYNNRGRPNRWSAAPKQRLHMPTSEKVRPPSQAITIKTENDGDGDGKAIRWHKKAENAVQKNQIQCSSIGACDETKSSKETSNGHDKDENDSLNKTEIKNNDSVSVEKTYSAISSDMDQARVDDGVVPSTTSQSQCHDKMDEEKTDTKTVPVNKTGNDFILDILTFNAEGTQSHETCAESVGCTTPVSPIVNVDDIKERPTSSQNMSVANPLPKIFPIWEEAAREDQPENTAQPAAGDSDEKTARIDEFITVDNIDTAKSYLDQLDSCFDNYRVVDMDCDSPSPNKKRKRIISDNSLKKNKFEHLYKHIDSALLLEQINHVLDGDKPQKSQEVCNFEKKPVELESIVLDDLEEDNKAPEEHCGDLHLSCSQENSNVQPETLGGESPGQPSTKLSESTTVQQDAIETAKDCVDKSSSENCLTQPQEGYVDPETLETPTSPTNALLNDPAISRGEDASKKIELFVEQPSVASTSKLKGNSVESGTAEILTDPQQCDTTNSEITTEITADVVDEANPPETKAVEPLANENLVNDKNSAEAQSAISDQQKYDSIDSKRQPSDCLTICDQTKRPVQPTLTDMSTVQVNPEQKSSTIMIDGPKSKIGNVGCPVDSKTESVLSPEHPNIEVGIAQKIKGNDATTSVCDSNNKQCGEINPFKQPAKAAKRPIFSASGKRGRKELVSYKRPVGGNRKRRIEDQLSSPDRIKHFLKRKRPSPQKKLTIDRFPPPVIDLDTVKTTESIYSNTDDVVMKRMYQLFGDDFDEGSDIGHSRSGETEENGVERIGKDPRLCKSKKVDKDRRNSVPVTAERQSTTKYDGGLDVKRCGKKIDRGDRRKSIPTSFSTERPSSNSGRDKLKVTLPHVKASSSLSENDVNKRKTTSAQTNKPAHLDLNANVSRDAHDNRGKHNPSEQKYVGMKRSIQKTGMDKPSCGLKEDRNSEKNNSEKVPHELKTGVCKQTKQTSLKFNENTKNGQNATKKKDDPTKTAATSGDAVRKEIKNAKGGNKLPVTEKPDSGSRKAANKVPDKNIVILQNLKITDGRKKEDGGKLKQNGPKNEIKIYETFKHKKSQGTDHNNCKKSRLDLQPHILNKIDTENQEKQQKPPPEIKFSLITEILFTKCDSLHLNPFPKAQKARCPTATEEWTDEAIILDSPDIRMDITIIKIIMSKANENINDVVEVKSEIPVIDLTEDVEEIKAEDSSIEAPADIKPDTKEDPSTITLYRSEETLSDSVEVQATVASMSANLVIDRGTESALATDNLTMKEDPVWEESPTISTSIAKECLDASRNAPSSSTIVRHDETEPQKSSQQISCYSLVNKAIEMAVKQRIQAEVDKTTEINVNVPNVCNQSGNTGVGRSPNREFAGNDTNRIFRPPPPYPTNIPRKSSITQTPRRMEDVVNQNLFGGLTPRREGDNNVGLPPTSASQSPLRALLGGETPRREVDNVQMPFDPPNQTSKEPGGDVGQNPRRTAMEINFSAGQTPRRVEENPPRRENAFNVNPIQCLNAMLHTQDPSANDMTQCGSLLLQYLFFFNSLRKAQVAYVDELKRSIPIIPTFATLEIKQFEHSNSQKFYAISRDLITDLRRLNWSRMSDDIQAAYVLLRGIYSQMKDILPNVTATWVIFLLEALMQPEVAHYMEMPFLRSLYNVVTATANKLRHMLQEQNERIRQNTVSSQDQFSSGQRKLLEWQIATYKVICCNQQKLIAYAQEQENRLAKCQKAATGKLKQKNPQSSSAQTGTRPPNLAKNPILRYYLDPQKTIINLANESISITGPAPVNNGPSCSGTRPTTLGSPSGQNPPVHLNVVPSPVTVAASTPARSGISQGPQEVPADHFRIRLPLTMPYDFVEPRTTTTSPSATETQVMPLLRSPVTRSAAHGSPTTDQVRSPVYAPVFVPPYLDASETAVDTRGENDIKEEDKARIMDIIDLTWMDDIDLQQVQTEVEFIAIKKEEPPEEEEGCGNQDALCFADSPADSGIASPPAPVEYSEEVFTDRICICGQPASYVCGCRQAMYCNGPCQNSNKNGQHNGFPYNY